MLPTSPTKLAHEMLPNEMWIEHLKGCDIPDVLAFAQCSRDCEEYASDNSVWKEIAKKINCPIEEKQLLEYRKGEIKGRVFHFIKDLQDQTIRSANLTFFDFIKARMFSRIPTPLSISFANDLPSIEHVLKMQQYLPAIDILKVQRKLAEIIGQIGPSLSRTIDVTIVIADSFPAWFNSNLTELQQVKVLNLRNLGLTSLPPEIGQMTGLQLLDCSDNQLTSLPKEIGLISSLLTLICSCNRISFLPPELGQLTLLWFDCRYNPLTSLPDSIKIPIISILPLKLYSKSPLYKYSTVLIATASAVSLSLRFLQG